MQSALRKSGFLRSLDFGKIPYDRRHFGWSSHSEGRWDLSSLYFDLASAGDSLGTRLKSLGCFVAFMPLRVQLHDLLVDDYDSCQGHTF
jgi:hypothetical protein